MPIRLGLCNSLRSSTTNTAIINTLRPGQNGRHFTDDIFKWIFLNENVWISIKISLTFVPKVPINNIPALVQRMAWRRSGDKPLSEPMMDSLLTHICVTRPQWIKRKTCFMRYTVYPFRVSVYNSGLSKCSEVSYRQIARSCDAVRFRILICHLTGCWQLEKT